MKRTFLLVWFQWKCSSTQWMTFWISYNTRKFSWQTLGKLLVISFYQQVSPFFWFTVLGFSLISPKNVTTSPEEYIFPYYIFALLYNLVLQFHYAGYVFVNGVFYSFVLLVNSRTPGRNLLIGLYNLLYCITF